MARLYKTQNSKKYSIEEKIRHYEIDMLGNPESTPGEKSFATVKLEYLRIIKNCLEELKRQDLSFAQRGKIIDLLRETREKNTGSAIRERLGLSQKGYLPGSTHIKKKEAINDAD